MILRVCFPIFVNCRQRDDVINLTLQIIKDDEEGGGKWGEDSSVSSLEKKVLEQSTAERRRYSHVNYMFTYVMNTLLIRSRTLIICYA